MRRVLAFAVNETVLDLGDLDPRPSHLNPTQE